MKLLRSILGRPPADPSTEKRAGDVSAEPKQAAPADSVYPAQAPELDPAARDVGLQRDFSRGLSDLARRQLQYEDYRWEPAAQSDPRGTWYVVDEIETHDGVLRPGVELQFVDLVGPADANRPRAWRLRTVDNRTHELPVDPSSGAPPAGLSRSLERGEG